jgi:prolipoprotein diacylglyceryltransferase
VHPHLVILHNAPSWTVLALLGTLTALVTGWRAAAGAVPTGVRTELAVVAIAGGWLSAKVGHVVFEARGHALPDGATATGIVSLLQADPWHWARLLEPGYVQLPGVAGGIGLGLLLLWRAGWWPAVPAVADAAAIAVAVGTGIGRVGCFLAGCCYGAPTTLPWAVHFPSTHSSAGVGVHPTQLYDVGAATVAVVVWLVLRRTPCRPGTAALLTTLTLLAARFITEFSRGDGDRGLWGPLSTSQWLSLLGMVVGAVLVGWRRRRARP